MTSPRVGKIVKIWIAELVGCYGFTCMYLE